MTQRRFPFRRKKKQQVAPKHTYAFIDSQNLNLGTQKMGWKMDWRKFRQYLTDNYDVQKAFMFIGYIPNNEDLYKQMKEAGYSVVLKPTVDMLMTEEELAEESHVTKGNADAELVLYAMKELPNYDKAVIVSGDGDFYCIVEYLVGLGKFKKLLTPNSHYSSLLEKFSEYIVNLDSVRRELVYEYIKKRPKKSTSPQSSRSRAQKPQQDKAQKPQKTEQPKAKKSHNRRRRTPKK